MKLKNRLIKPLKLRTVCSKDAEVKNDFLKSIHIVYEKLKCVENQIQAILFPLPMSYPVCEINIQTADHKNLTYELSQNQVKLMGRSRRAGFFLPDSQASAAHCAISMDAMGKVSVMDLRSANGSYINSAKILPFEMRTLKNGSRVKLGNATMQFKIKWVTDHGNDDFSFETDAQIVSAKSIPSESHTLTITNKHTNCSLKLAFDPDSIIALITVYFGIHVSEEASLRVPEHFYPLLFNEFFTSVKKRINSCFSQEITFCYDEENQVEINSELAIEHNIYINWKHDTFQIRFYSNLSDLSKLCCGEFGYDLKNFLKLDDTLLNDLQIPLVCTTSQISLPQNLFDQLSPGDVVMFNQHPDAWEDHSKNSVRILLSCGVYPKQHAILSGFLRREDESDSYVIIDKLFRNGEGVMEQQAKTREVAGFATSMCETRMLDIQDEIIIPLTVQVGTLSLTLRQIAAIERGTALSLGHDVREPLEIKIGDQTVAYGHLIQIDSEFGIEILERLQVKK